MKNAFYLLLCTLFFVGCAEQLEQVEYTNEEQNYKESYTVEKGTNTRQGTYVKRNLQGDLMEESFYQDGAMHGVQKIYDRGILYSISNFEKGQLQGLYQTFYQDGDVNVEGDYVNNVMHGKWKRYYPSGDLMEVVTFENNEENGPFVEFYPNGNVKAEGEYLDGDDEHGELLLYDINGILFKKMMCDRGRCSTTWVKPGKEDWEGFRND